MCSDCKTIQNNYFRDSTVPFIHNIIVQNIQNMEPEPKEPEQVQPQEDDYDDLQQLGLFHSSSLREPIDPPLDPQAAQTWQLKRSYGPDNSEFYNQYEIVKKLGRGAFGQVFQVRHGTKSYAMKVNSILGLEKQRFFAADGEFASSLDVLKNQLNISKRLRHPNIAACLEIIHGSDKICTINELGNLGQIMDWHELDENYRRNPQVYEYLCKKYKTSNLADITRIVFIEVCQAIKYLHSYNITNRDIKVDNIIARETEQQGNQVMVIDFTTVRYKKQDDISYFPTGTPGFRAPEHQFAGSDGYSCKATDVWSVGIAMWTFYHEKVPFPGQDDYERDANSKNMELEFDPTCPPILVEVISKMTKKEWKERITIGQALSMLKNQ